MNDGLKLNLGIPQRIIEENKCLQGSVNWFLFAFSPKLDLGNQEYGKILVMRCKKKSEKKV